MREILTEDRYKFLKREAHKLLNLSSNNNPFYLAKALKMNINICSLKDELKGFILDNSIYINDKLDLYSQKIICAHELGHYILHRNLNAFELFDTDTESITEFEANLVAKEIMPQMFSRIYMNENKYVSDFNKFIENQIRFSK